MKGLYCVLLLGCGRQSIHIGDSGIPSDAPDVCADCARTCDLAYAPSDSRTHVEGGVDYADAPPASGDHDPCWAPWGVHESPLNDENWVHNLEHGGVVFLYNCPEGCAEEVGELVTFASTLPENTWIVTPYAALATPYAAVAWNYRATSECLDLEAWASFYDYFADNAPESVTAMPGGSCL
jgi:hypothetical protein